MTDNNDVYICVVCYSSHGIVHTDHILFIASGNTSIYIYIYIYMMTTLLLYMGIGAFHHCSPSDLMPELQGRLPIRVNLSPLTEFDFKRILTETQVLHITIHIYIYTCSSTRHGYIRAWYIYICVCVWKYWYEFCVVRCHAWSYSSTCSIKCVH